MPAIEIDGLSIGFGSRTLVRDLSFYLANPGFLAVVGHNGSGKTSLFKAIQGHIPCSGKISIDGREASSFSILELSEALTVLEQRHEVSFPITVADLVLMGRFRHRGFFENYSEEDRGHARQALDTVGMADLADRDMTTLSGGEQQLAWLAQLIMQDSAIMLLDEPTQQLDLHNRRKVFSLISDWVDNKGKTVVCITHDLHELMGMRGYLLNLSEKNPALQELSETKIHSTIRMLQAAPA